MTAIELLEKADKILTFRTKKLRRDELISMIGKGRRLIMDTLALLAKPCEWKWRRRSSTWSVGCDKVQRYAPRTHHEHCSHCGKPIKEMR